MKVEKICRFTFGVLAIAALVSCAGSPKAVQEHSAVTVTVEKDVPLFDSSITGYAQLSRERKSVTMRLSFSLLDWTEAEPELRDLLRGLLYSGQSPEGYAADCTAALEKEYRDAGAALLAEPEDISGASFTWRHTETIKIRYSGGALLVISKVVYSYSGGAHGMETTEWFVIDREKAVRLGLGDVLTEGAEEPLRRAAAEALKKRGLPREGFSADVPTDNFFFGAEGLGFHYDPYEIAPYARGAVEIILPYGDIGDMLNHRGRTLADGFRAGRARRAGL